ncbi:hypothetical protein V6Z12_A10G242000 [Gossypium hirsutum]
MLWRRLPRLPQRWWLSQRWRLSRLSWLSRLQWRLSRWWLQPYRWPPRPSRSSTLPMNKIVTSNCLTLKGQIKAVLTTYMTFWIKLNPFDKSKRMWMIFFSIVGPRFDECIFSKNTFGMS